MHVRRLLLGLGIVALVVIAAGIWLVAHGLQARSHLLDVYDSAASLRDRLVSGDTTGVSASLTAIQHEAREARDDTNDPVWEVASHLPFVGHTVQVVRGAAAADDNLAQTVLPEMADVARALSPKLLRPKGDEVLLAPLHEALPRLRRTSSDIEAVRNDVSRLPSTGLLSSVARARRRLLAQLTTLEGTTRTAADFARIAPDMLGADGVRRYFVAVQNNAEARGTGGLVGAFMILQADHGHLSVTAVGNDTQLHDAVRPAVDVGNEFDRLYGPYGSTTSWRNSNLSPDFPVVARIWTALWHATQGQSLDGAIAIDPDVLADVLDVTGPVLLPDQTLVTGTNAVALTESDIYERFATDQFARKQFLRAVAKAVVDKVLAGAGDQGALAHALGADAGERHLQLWSAHPDEEAVIGASPLGALLPGTHRPVTYLVVNNVAGTKLDYWLRRTVVRQPETCRTDGTRLVTVTVRLTNAAPEGLPGYVVVRADHPRTPVPRGTNRLLVTTLVTHGSELLGATIDGRATTVAFGTEAGLASASTTLEIRPGQTHVLTLTLAEPGGGAPLVPVQPLAVPQVSDIGAAPPCGAHE